MTSNQYEAETETRERAHTSAVRELAESRNLLKRALTMAEAAGLPPFESVIDPSPPGGQNAGRSYPQWGKELEQAHAAALQYWTDARPYRHNALSTWREPLIEVSFAVEGDWETVSEQYEQDARQRGIEKVPEVVSLHDLGLWRYQEVELVWQQDGSGSIMSTAEERRRREKVHLPIAACQAVFEQLDDVLEEIGLLAEVRESESADTDARATDNGDEWSQYE